ncbi:MAG: histidine kinase dimerization/phospho-acceptor domain-containing protein, partial [Pseudomonadales bacterium]
MLKSRFLWQVWAAFGVTLAISTLVFRFVILDQVERDAYLRVESAMQSQARELSPYLLPILEGDEAISQAALIRQTPGTLARITLISLDGRVLADNQQAPLKMDNHGDREEIAKAALSSRALGRARRYSDTLGQTMLYLAVQLGEPPGKQGYLRLAYPVTSIEEQMASLERRINYAAVAIGLLFLIIGYGLAYRVTNPIRKITSMARAVAKGKFHLRLPEGGRNEIGQMARAINELARGVQQRIDELTENRNQLAAVLAGLTEGVIAFDLDKRVLHINAAALDMLGAKSDLPQNYLETTAPREIKQAVATSVTDRVSLSLTLSISARILECSTVIIQDATGVDTGGILVLEDVSARRRLERVRSDFVANASHELKTPISAIRGLVETIIDDPDMTRDVSARFVGRIRRQTVRLDRIVQDLLQLSRLDADEHEKSLTRLELAGILRQVYLAKTDDAADAHIALELDLQVASQEVEGDPEGLNQMVSNLVDNAIKYTDSGGKVQLRLLTAGSMAQIEVEDNGIGIS